MGHLKEVFYRRPGVRQRLGRARAPGNRTRSDGLVFQTAPCAFHQLLAAMPFNPDVLTIVECGESRAFSVNARAYACSARSPSGSLPNNQYLGLGWQGAIRHIGQVQGVVDIDLNTDDATVVYNNEPAPGLTDEQLIEEARQRLRLLVQHVLSVQRVFVLQALFPTEFRPPAFGGPFPRPHCLPVQCVHAQSAQELAQKLAGKT